MLHFFLLKKIPGTLSLRIGEGIKNFSDLSFRELHEIKWPCKSKHVKLAAGNPMPRLNHDMLPVETIHLR